MSSVRNWPESSSILQYCETMLRSCFLELVLAPCYLEIVVEVVVSCQLHVMRPLKYFASTNLLCLLNVMVVMILLQI